ncbi:MAG: ferrous iron transport protein B [Planctomycetaceae bacterium]|nr:MAG: ferrous iron transport protein B [Planctomycetaceae bacterium]
MSTPTRRVVLVGNPNTGKSTLFGVLSGMNVRTANYPGVTIEKKVGWLADPRGVVELVDLPGTYSLSPRSPDELVAVEVLTGDLPGEPDVDLIVCVVNATLLRRNLFLVSQLLELGKPVIVALNMIDSARSRGLHIDCERLAANLGVPVFALSASRREGIEELKTGIHTELTRQAAIAPQRPLPERFYEHCEDFIASSELPDLPSRYLVERAILDRGGEAERQLRKSMSSAQQDRLLQIRERIESELGPLSDVECDSRYAWAKRQTEGVLGTSEGASHRPTQWLDGILIHRVWGLAIFTLLMFFIFQVIYAWSGIPMDAIGAAQDFLTSQVEAVMAPGTLRSLLTDGVIAGVGSVVIFLPQIAMLFLFLAVLEDCGYMARAAFLVDRVMGLFGLSGKSFLPLMSSFACAVPGVMATRVIENRRDRFATILVAPFMSCSARLPVYLLMISAFVPAVSWAGGLISLSGLVLMGMYFVGVVVAIPTAWLLKKTLLRGEAAPFVLELPEYKIPDPWTVLRRVWDSCKAFLVRAGTLIFAASIVIWATAYWPADHTRRHELQRLIESSTSDSDPIGSWQDELKQVSAVALENSLLGRLGHAIEPIVRPLGWDWKIGVGALASFPAREVIIATLGTIYSLGGDVDEESDGLISALRDARWPDGRPVYNLPVALSIMVFFALCAQCVSTLLVIRRETNSWRWPILSFVYMTLLAYVGALVTYQVSSRWFG